MRIFIILLLTFLFIFSDSFSQGSFTGEENDKSSLELRGYLSNMQSVMFTDVKKSWINDNLFHNRLNFYWYYGNNLTASIQFRNRFMYGQTITVNPGYAESIDNEENFLDLSMNIFNERSFFLNTAIDRLFLQYTAGKFVFTAGRQRINWGQTMVWNPNDVFNVQNFFDFDYPEKPGSDAIRLQYYPNYTSSLELAAKLDKNDKVTAAVYYRFNKVGYDWQIISGVLAEDDIFAGIGWAGDIEGAGFRGETSYFHPLENSADMSGLFIASLSLDYTFSNSFYLLFETLYNMKAEGSENTGFFEFYQGTLDVKKLSFSEWNFFLQASYPFTPLLNASLSGIYFPEVKGFYAGPSIDYSLKDNAELSFISQIFDGEFPDPLTGNSTGRTTLFAGFLRYKFSF
ncbi:MAG: hypothetical protein ACP5E3_10310 [Bacteroidales bacterium]